MGLREYVIRRVAQVVITLWAFITVLFLLFRALPGDPTSKFVLSGISEEAQEEMIRSFGLDQPLHIQYINYVKDFMTGDLGVSFMYREPVWNVIVTKFWNTIFIMAPALILAILLGVIIGGLVGWKRGTLFEQGGVVTAIVARSSPGFWTGIVLLMVFVFWLNWFPAGGIRQAGPGTSGFVGKYLRVGFLEHAILPIITMTITYLSVPILLMRTSMVETLNADFIKIKRAEGLPERNILYKHAVRNSILPIVTITALASGLMIGGSVVIETVFNWPGMGREMVRAVNNQDFPLAQGLFFFMGATVMVMNLVADLAYVYLDPRIQYD